MSQEIYYLVECDEPYIPPTVCESELDAKVFMAFTDRKGGCSGTHKITQVVGPDWDMMDRYRAEERAARMLTE